MTDASALAVRENPAESRFEVSYDEQVVGYAYYEADYSAADPAADPVTVADPATAAPSGGIVVFTHTEVLPSAGGHGVGGALARAALDAVRASGRQAVPLCPFIAGYIGKHPEYLDLVPEAYRDRVPPPA